MQAAIPPRVFETLEKRFDVRCELFASPLNAHFKEFCSASAMTDRAFGSLGNAFDFEPSEGSFECNPPFDEEIISRLAGHVERLLSRAKKTVVLFRRRTEVERQPRVDATGEERVLRLKHNARGEGTRLCEWRAALAHRSTHAERSADVHDFFFKTKPERKSGPSRPRAWRRFAKRSRRRRRKLNAWKSGTRTRRRGRARVVCRRMRNRGCTKTKSATRASTSRRRKRRKRRRVAAAVSRRAFSAIRS